MSKIFKIVKKYIDDYDYYGLLRDGAPDDEFVSESLRISDRISEDSSIEQIAATIADVFHIAFGNDEEPNHYIPVAQKIWSELHTRQEINKEVILQLINWWRNTDTQGMDIEKYLLSKVMNAFGTADITEILSFLDSLPVCDLETISGCFEKIYAKFMTEDVYEALGSLENKICK